MNSEYTENINNIRNTNRKFKEFYTLDSTSVGDDYKYEDSGLTNFLFQKFLMLRNVRSMISISLIFTGYFAYREEFD